MQKIGQLKTIGEKIVIDMLGGKLGSGISNADVELVRGAFANIANPDIPADARLAAFRQLKANLDSLAAGKPIQVATPAASAASATSLRPIDQKALAWANANPNDPRAAAIKQRLGVQ